MARTQDETQSDSEALEKPRRKRTLIAIISASLIAVIAAGIWVAVGVIGCGTPLVGTYKENKDYGALNGVITLYENGMYELGHIDIDGEYTKTSEGRFTVHSGDVILVSHTVSGQSSDVTYQHLGRYLVDQYFNRYRKLSEEEAKQLLGGD